VRSTPDFKCEWSIMIQAASLHSPLHHNESMNRLMRMNDSCLRRILNPRGWIAYRIRNVKKRSIQGIKNTALKLARNSFCDYGIR
jgi:hypothetical protein